MLRGLKRGDREDAAKRKELAPCRRLISGRNARSRFSLALQHTNSGCWSGLQRNVIRRLTELLPQYCRPIWSRRQAERTIWEARFARWGRGAASCRAAQRRRALRRRLPAFRPAAGLGSGRRRKRCAGVRVGLVRSCRAASCRAEPEAGGLRPPGPPVRSCVAPGVARGGDGLNRETLCYSMGPRNGAILSAVARPHRIGVPTVVGLGGR